MDSLPAWRLSTLRRQHLFAEFSGLKQACPDGVFMSLTQGDPTLWSGVLFVRQGPYSSAILRFQISFPDAYPRLPPLVTFASDIFHPLITPLTTFIYSTDVREGGTVSASDDERLPPGGFNLRHGFPAWFGRGGGGRAVRAESSATREQHDSGAPATAAAAAGSPAAPRAAQRRDVSIYEILSYVKSVFDDETALDAVPLEAAGNPSAWHAWRTRQQCLGKTLPGAVDESAGAGAAGQEGSESVAAAGMAGGRDAGGGDAGVGTDQPPPPSPPPPPKSAGTSRSPDQWNWNGVWEERVRKGISASLSEAVLYGGTGAIDEAIRFLPLDETELEAARDKLRQTLGNPA